MSDCSNRIVENLWSNGLLTVTVHEQPRSKESILRLSPSEHAPPVLLKRAFEGKLVDQDPSDEPASALLERIRAERGATHTSTVSRRTSRGTAS